MTSATIIGFDSIVVFSFAVGLLVLCTAIGSSEVRRQPTWFGFLVPLLIYDIIFILGMGYQTDAGPPESFCIFQAVLLYSTPGWIVMGFGCFIIAFYFDLRDTVTAEEDEEYSPPPVSKWASFSLLITPLVFFSGFITLNGVLVALDANKPRAILNSYKLYCTPKKHTGLYVGGTAMGIGMSIWIFVILKAGILLHRHSLKIRGKSEFIYNRFLSVYVRVAAISIAGSLCVGLFIWYCATNSADSILGSYCLSFPSIIILGVFGSQKDIIQVWAFWRRASPQTLEDRSVLSRTSFSATGARSFTQSIIITAIGSEAKTHGNWKRLGYNWNFKAKTQGGVHLNDQSSWNPGRNFGYEPTIVGM